MTIISQNVELDYDTHTYYWINKPSENYHCKLRDIVAALILNG